MALGGAGRRPEIGQDHAGGGSLALMVAEPAGTGVSGLDEPLLVSPQASCVSGQGEGGDSIHDAEQPKHGRQGQCCDIGSDSKDDAEGDRDKTTQRP